LSTTSCAGGGKMYPLGTVLAVVLIVLLIIWIL
jgi:hypothetical protein